MFQSKFHFGPCCKILRTLVLNASLYLIVLRKKADWGKLKMKVSREKELVFVCLRVCERDIEKDIEREWVGK